MYPVTVTGMLFPTDDDVKVATGVPERVTLPKSTVRTPDKAAVPLNVALVFPSKTLESAVIPVIVSSFGVTVLEAVATFTVDAPVLAKEISPAYGESETVAVSCNLT